MLTKTIYVKTNITHAEQKLQQLLRDVEEMKEIAMLFKQSNQLKDRVNNNIDTLKQEIKADIR